MSDYWTDYGLVKPQQVVVCAAIKIGDVILCGARHCDSAMRSQAKAIGIITMQNGQQGFIDQFGDFLTRKEAMNIVKENGQTFHIERNQGDSVLYSEGLY